ESSIDSRKNFNKTLTLPSTQCFMGVSIIMLPNPFALLAPIPYILAVRKILHTISSHFFSLVITMYFALIYSAGIIFVNRNV
ncbi:MAG: hypothetical protein QXX35_05785, partial [Desulfurococcaceae archaeon]